MSDITIRRAAEPDLASIVELWIALMDLHRDSLPSPLVADAAAQHEEFVRQRISNDDTLILVAEIEGETVGYCRARIAYYPPVYEPQPYGTIAELIVAEKFRRQSIGEKLYQATLEWLVKRGITRIELATAADNAVSNAFWSKMGFKTFREIKQHYV